MEEEEYKSAKQRARRLGYEDDKDMYESLGCD